MDKSAKLLSSAARVWNEAKREQRDKLARSLSQAIRVTGRQPGVVGLQAELKPFFRMTYEEFANRSMKKRPRGGLAPHVRLSIGTYPVLAPFYLTVPPRSRRRLSPCLWSEIIARHEGESLRQLAKQYGVSHEAVRRILRTLTSSS